jgi:ribA/ribD-fused uncharacterized protein
MTIGPFVGKYKIYSNFYPVSIIFEGKIYPTVEHAYVAAKTLNLADREKIRKLPAEKAGYIKSLGRTLKLREDWEEVKDHIMFLLVFYKFKHNKRLYEELISTENKEIIEINRWHDNYWGDCYCSKCQNIKGLNKLGKIIMTIRKQLQEENRLNTHDITLIK